METFIADFILHCVTGVAFSSSSQAEQQFTTVDDLKEKGRASSAENSYLQSKVEVLEKYIFIICLYLKCFLNDLLACMGKVLTLCLALTHVHTYVIN